MKGLQLERYEGRSQWDPDLVRSNTVLRASVKN
jgi:hypothetical protein